MGGGGGGGGGGDRSLGDIRSLIDRAKKELREGEREGKRNVFLSFAHEDLNAVNLLRGQAKNDNSPLEFNDWSVSEPIDSDRASYIMQKISERIEQSSLTVVYLSDRTSDSAWVNWEVEETLKRGKQVLGVFPQGTEPAVKPRAIVSNKIRCVSWPELADVISKLP